MKRCIIALALALILLLCSCGVKEAVVDSGAVDFAVSVFKHITNGGVTEDEKLPYNVDAITGATLTVEGPAVVSSIPLSVRELENRTEGLFRGVYEDSSGSFIYEGVDLYYMLHDMTDGDNGILLTDTASRVQLKDSNRETVASFSLSDVAAAHEAGRPLLIAYGIGSADGKLSAPFVFDGKNEGEHTLGYIDQLNNDDGCLRLVYDLNGYGDNADYRTFSNVAYIYVCEEAEPGFKHSLAGGVYSSPDYLDYIISFRGEALGGELNLTVAQLEALVRTGEDGTPVSGGVGYSDYYSLANNAYWYVNQYEGLDLYKLLCYLGMEDAGSMGRAASRTTLITFNAADGRQSPEAFSVEALSYPDAFGYYKKNAADQGDGSYVSTNEDLVKTGYPVLLAYGVNNYPYTVGAGNPGFLSGLANSGGPMRVVFGKTQYNHANGSNQVQYLSEVIVGNDRLYNTHSFTDDPDLNSLADSRLDLIVTGPQGEALIDRSVTVGDIESMIYGPEVAGNEKAAAKVKAVYELNGEQAVLEGLNLEHYLMNIVGIPGTIGTATFSNGSESVTLSLDQLFAEGVNPVSGLSGLPSLLAFAKNGSPLVTDADDKGYIENISLNPASPEDPAVYGVDNQGGPLMLLVPPAEAGGAGQILENVTSLSVSIQPDSYAHLTGEAAALSGSEIRFYGEGLERELTYTVADLENRQTRARTLDYSVLNKAGALSEARYRGMPVYELFTEIGIRNNAGEVTVYSADGSSVTLPLSRLKGQSFTNYVSPHKASLCAMLAYGMGDVDGDITSGSPLTTEDGGPVTLMVPMGAEDEPNSSLCLKNVVAVEVSANDVTTWSHSMSDIYSEFLDYEMTLTIQNDKNEWTCALTVAQLEALTSLVVREQYEVLEIGVCEGIDLWKLVKLLYPDIPEPVSVTVYAEDGYKNDLLSVFYMDGLENGVLNSAGERRPLIIAYAINGAPLVDDENHEGYTGLSGNSAGPLRIVAESVQGASVKLFNRLVITLPGEGEIEADESVLSGN